MNMPRNRSRGHLLLRHVLPVFLLVSFLGLASWAGGRFVFPSRSVTVGSAHGTQFEAVRETIPLIKATGWVEPCPTPLPVAAAPPVVDKPLVTEDDVYHAYERALADLKVREAELEEAKAVLNAAILRLERPVHLELPLFEAEVALAKIETEVRNGPFEVRCAEGRLDFAKRDCERKTALKGVIAGRNIDEARSAFTEAASFFEKHQAQQDSLEEEREALVAYRNALKTQLELKVGETNAKTVAESKLSAARARVKQAGIHLAGAKSRLDRINVRAPNSFASPSLSPTVLFLE